MIDEFATQTAGLAEEVKQHRRWWREWDSQFEKINSTFDGAPNAGWLLARVALAQGRQWRRFLRSRYGFVWRPGSEVRGRWLNQTGVTPDAVNASMTAISITVTNYAAYAAYCLATAGGADDAKARLAVLNVLQRLPAVSQGALMTRGVSEASRTIGALSLAGWVADGTSLHRNLRLRAALAAEGQSPYTELYWRLPSAVAIAWAERGPSEVAKGGFITHVAREIERDRKREARSDALQLEKLSVPGSGFSPSAEDFVLREEAKRQFAERLQQLTPREREVMELRADGYLEREIAAKLRVKVGTVKTLISRARAKLKRSA